MATTKKKQTKKTAPATPAKKRWSVTVPFTGCCVVEVEADDEQSAIDAALASEDLNIDDRVECEFHERIVRGNVFYGTQNAAEAEEIEP